MTVLIIQTLLLMAIAFILGCILGCLLRSLFGTPEVETPSASIGAAAGLGAVGAATVAAQTPAAPAAKAVAPVAPAVPKPPMPTPPVAKPATPITPLAATPPPAAPKPAARKAPAKKAAKPKPAPKPKPAAKAAPVASAATKDNLKLIRGIGPQNEGRLNNLGIYQFAQIADWKAKDERHYGDVLAFPGRIEREEWVKQAKVLAKGGQTEFAGRVASGAVGSSLGSANAGNMGKAPSNTLTAARGGKADNLTLIDGVGNAIEKKMFKLGIYHFDQVASMSKDELAWLGNSVGFPGRPERENWKGESKILAAGGTTDHARRVERGEIKTSRKT